MLKKLLIANRGEIARRIIRTARRLGIETVAVASDADLDMPFAREADACVPIGPGPASESYLAIPKILAAARATGADAVHPGYGFLSENADFAAAVADAGLIFVGPSASAMRALGGKAEAKRLAIAAGVPVVPGYQGDDQALKVLTREAARIGYPVMIKAVAGGGGRGMRLVPREGDLADLLESARREAQGAFGDDRVLIEKVVQAPRHIEVQVFGDRHGNVVHLFERDCSLQRRNQKVIEEAPAPGMSPELRERMTAAATGLARSVGYEGAGTVEFLVEGGSLGAGAPWYFIEMNTRLQVEHPVTEAITGLDLVEWQLRIASGERLPLTQAEIGLDGHAIEARLCAEDPAKGFMPSIGTIVALAPPKGEGVRCDMGPAAGNRVPPFYDSMIGKLITHGADRETARVRLLAALEHTHVAGVRTNALFLHRLLSHSAVVRGEMDTGLIGRDPDRLTAPGPRDEAVAAGIRHLLSPERRHVDAPLSPWDAQDGFQLGGERRLTRPLWIDGEPQMFELVWPTGVAAGPHVRALSRDGAAPSLAEPPRIGVQHVARDGRRVLVLADLVETEVALPDYDPHAIDDGEAGDQVRAPINGRVARIFPAPGASVAKGDPIAVVEAMKMEHVIAAPRDGTVERIEAPVGEQVVQGAVIVALKPVAAK